MIRTQIFNIWRRTKYFLCSLAPSSLSRNTGTADCQEVGGGWGWVATIVLHWSWYKVIRTYCPFTGSWKPSNRLQSSKIVTLDRFSQYNCCLGVETEFWHSLLFHIPWCYFSSFPTYIHFWVSIFLWNFISCRDSWNHQHFHYYILKFFQFSLFGLQFSCQRCGLSMPFWSTTVVKLCW